LKKQIYVVAAIAILSGCAAVPNQTPTQQAKLPAKATIALPPGYVDVANFSQDRLALYAASKWVNQAKTEDERFSRGMRAFADLRKDYFARLNAGLSMPETKKALAARIAERTSANHLPEGTKGLAILVRDEAYPVTIANFKEASGKVEIAVGGGAYGVRIPSADAVLNASTSKSKPFHQNVLAITDSMNFEGKKVRGDLAIAAPRVFYGYSIPKEQFATALYENRKLGLDTVLKTSGYVLFELSTCDEDKQWDQLTCWGRVASYDLTSPKLLAQRAGR
jgi:hypothetical protein